MEGLTESEKKFFESGGQTEVETPAETVAETVEVKSEVPVKPEVVEKKEPAKFTYSKDTDNVVDENGRKYVPLGAIQEARNENKTLKKQIEELQTKWTGGEQKLNALLKKLESPAKEAPKYEENPLEHLKSKNAELEATVQALKSSDEKRSQESQSNSQMAEFQRNVTAVEKAFAKENPDYSEAVAKVQEVWRHEYEMAGVPDQLIDSLLARKGAQFTHAAMQREQNAAEAVYKLAQRYGYRKEQKDEPNKDKDKLAQIAKGQEAEKSLTSGKGPADMSLEALATMSDEEMEAFVADQKNWKKLSKAA